MTIDEFKSIPDLIVTTESDVSCAATLNGFKLYYVKSFNLKSDLLSKILIFSGIIAIPISDMWEKLTKEQQMYLAYHLDTFIIPGQY